MDYAAAATTGQPEANAWSFLGNLLAPKDFQAATLTPIRTDQPVSDAQENTNKILFMVAVVILLIFAGVTTWYFLKR